MKRKSPNTRKAQPEDLKWMRLALNLAEKGRLSVSPNPMVGACLVRGGKFIAQGFHRAYGEEHAEIAALKKAGAKAKGAVLYVTLEPCASWGKTPPCADAVLKSGIKRVVIGALDPNPVNRAQGIKKFRSSGMEVSVGVLEKEVRKQNESFFKYMNTQLPFVTLKMAQSLDGKIATREGHSRWISSKPAREFVHRLRAEQDAILVGTNTLKLDNPMLIAQRISKRYHLPYAGQSQSRKGGGTFCSGRERKPWRVVLDSRFEISARARVFEGEQLTLIAVSEKMIKSKRVERKKMPSGILLPVAEKNGRLNLQDLLKKLGSLGVSKLLVEGGGELAWSLVEEKLVDKFFWIIAPKFIGGRNAKTSLEGEGVKLASDAFPVEIIKQSMLGEDILLEGKPKSKGNQKVPGTF